MSSLKLLIFYKINKGTGEIFDLTIIIIQINIKLKSINALLYYR